MKTEATPESLWRLRADLASTRALLWLSRAGRRREVSPELHLYFYDRYWRLSQYHERRGQGRQAARLKRRAEWHYRQSGDDGPPFAAALALPIPRPAVVTRAAGWPLKDPPDEAA